MIRLHLFLSILHRRVEQVPLPFLIPDRFEAASRRVTHALEVFGTDCLDWRLSTSSGSLHPLAHKVGNPPARDLQQPALEPAARRIVSETWHLLGDRDDRLLHHLL